MSRALLAACSDFESEPEPHSLDYHPFSRFAIPARISWIRQLIPAGYSGVYLFTLEDIPIYVGRSDTCLLTRLSGHELLRVATHVIWEPCEVKLAFELECFWFHKLKGSRGFINVLHPAHPGGELISCPYCEPYGLVFGEWGGAASDIDDTT